MKSELVKTVLAAVKEAGEIAGDVMLDAAVAITLAYEEKKRRKTVELLHQEKKKELKVKQKEEREEKRVIEIIEEVREEICTSICKFPERYTPEEWDEIFIEVCKDCPMDKL